MKKALAVAVLVLLASTGGTAVGSNVASGATGINASKYLLTCTKQTGGVSFSPVLRETGSSHGHDTLTIAATLSGCKATPTAGGKPLTVTKGVVTGSLVGDVGNSCTTLFLGGVSLPFVGSLSIKWTTSPALTSGNTKITMKSGTVGLAGSAPNTTLTFPGLAHGTVGGSFSANPTDSFSYSRSSATPLSLLHGCESSAGLKTIPGSSGLVVLGVPPTSVSVSCPNDSPIVAYASIGGVCAAKGGYPANPSLVISSLVKWTSSNPGVAAIGVETLGAISIVPKGAGTARITGSLGSRSGSGTVTIVEPPKITTTTLPDGQVGVPYDQTLSATSGTPPYTWIDDSLSEPGWMTFDPTTGEITGTPTAPGTYDLDFQIQDAAGNFNVTGDDQFISFTVDP